MTKEDLRQIAGLLEPLHADIVDLKVGQKELMARQEALEARQGALEVGQKELIARQEALEARQGALEARQEALEVGQKDLVARQEALEVGQKNLQARQEALEVGQKNLVARQDKFEASLQSLTEYSRQTRVLLEKQEHNIRLVAEQYTDISEKLDKANDRAAQIDDMRERLRTLETVVMNHSAILRGLDRAE